MACGKWRVAAEQIVLSKGQKRRDSHRMARVTHGGGHAMRDFAQKCIDTFKVKASGVEATASSLSGGNLQKFIMGREILLAPKLMVVAQPTWGVDVGAAAFLRQKLLDLAGESVAIVLLSEELDEIFQVADNIAVIAHGRLSPIKDIDDTTPEEIGVWMSGLFSEQVA